MEKANDKSSGIAVGKESRAILRSGRFWVYCFGMFIGAGAEFTLTFWAATYLQLNFNATPWQAGVGTAAIAAATEIACVGGIIYSGTVFLKSKCPFTPCFDKYLFARIYALGVPGSLSSFAYNMAITVTVGCIGAMGIVALNAYSYVNNIVTYSATFSTVAASCISVFVGRYAGRGDVQSIKKICRLLLFLSISVNAVISFVIFILRNPLLSFFTDNEEIFSMCLIILAIDFVIECGRGVVHVLEASMNASRNVIVTMLSGIISAWAIIVLFTYVLGIVFGLGLVGCWIAFAISELAKATVYIIYFKKEKWIKTII